MIGSRQSDHYFRSVCLFVCLRRVFLSRLRNDLDQTRTHVTCPGLVVSPRIWGLCDPWRLDDPQKTCIFRGFGAAVNHHSGAASYYYSAKKLKLRWVLQTLCGALKLSCIVTFYLAFKILINFFVFRHEKHHQQNSNIASLFAQYAAASMQQIFGVRVAIYSQQNEAYNQLYRIYGFWALIFKNVFFYFWVSRPQAP